MSQTPSFSKATRFIQLTDPIDGTGYGWDHTGFVPHIIQRNDYYFDIARDILDGYDSEFKFGRSSNITSTESVIWDGGGNYTFLTTAERFNIVSTNAVDSSTGIGARTLIIYGLDNNYNLINEVITMAGLTPVLSSKSYIRIFRMMVLTSGTSNPITDANIGTISATGAVSGTLIARILPNNGQTLMTPYTIPAGYNGYVTGISLSAGQGKQCLFKGKFRNGPTTDYAFSVKFTMDLYQNSFTAPFIVPLKVPEKTDLLWTGTTGLGGTVEAGASYGILLERIV